MTSEKLLEQYAAGQRDFVGADLAGADLTGAYLIRADLAGANLTGVTINWDSHTLLSEILWRAAENIEQEMFAAHIGRQIGWCWEEYLNSDLPQVSWALDVLRAWVQPNDNAPECLSLPR